MSIRIDPETRWLESDDEITYSQDDVLRLRTSCPDCGAIVIPKPIQTGDLADMKQFRPGRRWRCPNGHGSPDSL